MLLLEIFSAPILIASVKLIAIFLLHHFASSILPYVGDPHPLEPSFLLGASPTALWFAFLVVALFPSNVFALPLFLICVSAP